MPTTNRTNNKNNQQQVTLSLSSIKFSKKPAGFDAVNITQTIANSVETLSIQEFAEEISTKGRTAMLAVLQDRKNRNNAISEHQELLMIDIDNDNKYQPEFTIQQALAHDFIKENALFLYETFSSTQYKQRFRIVFMLDSSIVSKNIIKTMYESMHTLFPQADKRLKEPNRMFYGSITGYIAINEFRNRLSPTKLISDINRLINQDLKLNAQKLLQSQKRLEEYQAYQKKKEQDLEEYEKTYIKQTSKELTENLPNMDFIDCIKELNNIYIEEEALRDKNKLERNQKIKRSRHKKVLKRLQELFKAPALRTYLQLDQYSFTDFEHASKFIAKLDMVEILGNKTNNKVFKDIFSIDNKPSASIYKHTSLDIYFYYTFKGDDNEQLVGDIFQVLRKLAPRKFYTRTLAVEFMIEILGLQNKNTSLLGIKRNNLLVLINELESFKLKESKIKNKCKEEYKHIYKRMYKDRLDIIIILNILSNHVYYEPNSPKDLLCYKSMKTLISDVRKVQTTMYCETEESSNLFSFISENRVKNIMNLLATLEVVDKLRDSQISPTFKNMLKQHRATGQSSYYYPNSYTVSTKNERDYMEKIEANAQILVDSGVSNSSLNYRSLSSAFNEEKAKQCFENTKKAMDKGDPSKISTENPNLTKTQQQFYNAVEYFLKKGLKNNIYMTHNNLYEKLSVTCAISKNTAKNRFYTFKKEILTKNELVEINLNANNKQALNLHSTFKQKKAIVHFDAIKDYKLEIDIDKKTD